MKLLATALLIALSITPANALDGSGTLADWVASPQNERALFSEQYAQVAQALGVTVSADDITSCIDEVARSPALRDQSLDEVAKSCMVLIVQQR